MKYIYKILVLILLVTTINSCDKNENFEILPKEDSFSIITPTSGSVIVLNDANLLNNGLFISWNDTVNSDSSYTIEVDKTGNNFANPIILATVSTKSFGMSVVDLNSFLINDMGLNPDEANSIDLKVSNATSSTDIINIILTPTNVDFESVSLIGSFLNDWDTESALEMNNKGFNIFQMIVDLPDAAEFKFVTTKKGLENDWGKDPSNTSNIIFDGEENIGGYPANKYKITVDFNTFTYTVEISALDLSTSWGIVGSATTNGWDGPDMPFYQTGVDNIFDAYVTLANGEIKFRENNSWDLNYGDNGNDGSLEAGGSNIPVNEGSYKITIDLNTLSWSMEAYSWGIVGSAAPNGWDGPDVMFNYDPFSDTFKTVATLGDGEIKFRQNNDWAVNYGDTGADGTLENGGDNIAVSAGNYLVTLDFTDSANPVYSIEAMDLWGVVGSAAPNGWDGPDTKFTPDFSGIDGLYYIKNISLSTGEIKFRLNDDWGVNYGGTSGILEEGGANIAVDAGVYNITLDFSDTTSPKYIIE